jgi:hypothetical protein
LFGEKEKNKVKWPEGFFPWVNMPSWLCHEGFSWLLGAIKG